MDINSYLLGLVSALVGILVKHFLDKTRAAQSAERARRQIACDKFRTAVAEEISLWHRLDGNADKIIGSVNTDFLKNTSIIATLVDFRPFVNKPDAYEKASKAYETYKKQVFTNRMGFIETHPDAFKFLETLLHFADN